MNKQRPDTKADVIRQLWASGIRNKAEIARRAGCSKSNVTQVLTRSEEPAPRPKPKGPRTCQRPDIDNGLKPCGRPLHEIGGEKLGICKHHWDTFKPLGNQKTPITGQRASRRYG